MKALLWLALGLASAAVHAQEAGPSRAAASERPAAYFQAAQAAKPSRPAEPQRSQLAALAIAFTDDADSIRLPAFATRTTPLPIRFLRVGVEWRF